MRHGSERDPVRDAQLGGHVSEAGVHGVRPDVQPPGHNTVGQSLGHQQTGLLIAVQKRCSARTGWPYAYLSVDIPIRRYVRTPGCRHRPILTLRNSHLCKLEAGAMLTSL
jgi:hypothetical protein